MCNRIPIEILLSKKNGLYNALPHLVSLLMSIVFGSLSDRLLSRGHLKVSTAAKMFECIGSGIPAISVGLMGFFTQVTNSSDSFTNLEFPIFLTNINNDFWQTEKNPYFGPI